MNNEEYEHYRMQELLGKQQIDAQTSMYAPQLFQQVQEQKAVLVEQTDPSKTVKNIIACLSGIEEDKNGNKRQVYPPKLNQIGINSINFQLKSFISNEIRFTRLEKNDIRKIMDRLQDDLVDSLKLNFHRWGIKNKSDLDDINNTVLINIYACLKRAEGQNEKNWIGRISMENISGGSSRIPLPKKEGFLNKFRLG